MKREIKFRGKRINDGKWIYGGLSNYCSNFRSLNTNKLVIFENIASFATDNFVFVVDDCEVDPDTVGQFTGLHDTNGKEIYEGDIIWMNSLRIDMGIVEWDNERSAFVARIHNTPDRFCLWDGYEVIGNIHDNMDLLKGGDQ